MPKILYFFVNIFVLLSVKKCLKIIRKEAVTHNSLENKMSNL